MGLLFVLGVGLIAGVVSGIIGTGSSIMLVPVLAFVYGPKEAVPIMAVAAVMANASRILAWWREVDWRAFAAYAGPGALAAVAGARTLLVLPPRGVDLAIGAFLVSMVPARRWLGAHLLRLNLWHLATAGAVIGFLTGIVVSTGPISVPVFVGYGLAKGAFIGTEAAGSLAVYASKTLTFQEAGALPSSTLLKGLVVGTSLMIGAFLAKPFVLRLSPDVFRYVMDGLMLASGASMIWSAASAS
ncbi:sulfite exporter TauE/SafE family protein [Methylobacterium planeticum]|uniref:Probable membrane transporter protein n=1 Tax=Methylobacterium planeticum TaxID=2615211 RepID=A0A6N6MNB3_9HYPH|nr:sulfite exporter TauE/SafE family protein [Methylobacterium planeticum]KAB1071649.1 sulfite exporter TauE/SafE family protein [Methylobacterium planeticum]